MNKTLLLIFIISALICFNGCNSSDMPAYGPEDEIFVVADSMEFIQIESALKDAFEKIINTPQPEVLFTVKRIAPAELEKNKKRKNIIIAAPLNTKSVTSEFIGSIVDSATLRKIRTGELSYVKKENLWAKNQLVIIMSAPTIEALGSNIQREKDNLLYSFQSVSDQRLIEGLYNSKYEQKNIEGMLLANYGWIIYVQDDFKMAKNSPPDNFVWLRSSPGTDLERWIFVHWIDSATADYLSEDSIKSIRNRLTYKFYQTSAESGYVKIAADNYYTSEVNFKNRYALFTQGLWEMNLKGMGGPFINYSFIDEKSKRLYMLDASIYAPKYYKRNLIQQADVLLQSFMTADELSLERHDELIEASKK